MSFGERFRNCCQIHWQGFFYLISPLVILPLIFLQPFPQWRTLFIILWSFIWYVAEPAPLAAIAIIPIVFIPILGVMGSNQICMSFCLDTNMLFLLCNFVAVAMQHSNIVKRQAFFILSNLSCNPQNILIILMVSSYIFTAFLPAAFVCALMMPTIRAILVYLEELGTCRAVNANIETKFDETPYPSKVAIAFYIGTAFAINIGSITMPLSSDSGLALRDLINNEPDLSSSSLNELFYLKYLLPSLPISLLLLLFTLGYLEIIYLGLKRPSSEAAQGINFDREGAKVALDNLANDIPQFNMHMAWVAVLYFLSVVGIIVVSILNPQVNDKLLKYSVNGMLLCFFYFVLPRDLDFCNYFRCSAPKEFKSSPSVLPWGAVHKITPWSVFFVHGSSVAIGALIKHTDLHLFVGEGLTTIQNHVAQQTGFIVMTMIMTLIASNNLVAEVMLSMGLKAVSAEGSGSIAALLYPTSWACCLTFLLPVSSSANCFAMGWGNIRARDMMLAAVGPTVFGFLIILITAIIMGAVG